ncbi:hypothetical protein GLAREA_00889 [Glarea lozoyensis ATCC 20868]|uniref:Uncharacterized protein n=1 Tax=Glarea lozoyensis (strain ATCC 20868 / MF5171) TaxID=1116229 RepID=S3CXS0_GLAL2|nr:uncharacterized protein GLAREA_00889 [Glarea lozoyensis ATCC 20868]EPE29729.1 hypothetical protein GLAREA_00889 [Glarea lozoyensis ATCC 20868]
MAPTKGKSSSSRRRKKEVKISDKPAPKFDAFEVTDRLDSGEIVTRTEAPKVGIHSLAWAYSIEPQPGTILSLPYEIREIIYCYYFRGRYSPGIQPVKSGRHFINYDVDGSENGITSVYGAFILVSKQFYLDHIYSFYNNIVFLFSSLHAFQSYIQVIHPLKVDRISRLSIKVVATAKSNPFSPTFFRNILGLKSLRKLNIIVLCDSTTWEPVTPDDAADPFRARWRHVEESYFHRWKRVRWEQLRQLGKLKDVGFDFEIRNPEVLGMSPVNTWHHAEAVISTKVSWRTRFVSTVAGIVWPHGQWQVSGLYTTWMALVSPVCDDPECACRRSVLTGEGR